MSALSRRWFGSRWAIPATFSCLVAFTTGQTVGAGTVVPAPLTTGEIRSYLAVMRPTAERIAHPTPEDRTAAARWDAARDRQSVAYAAFEARHKDGSVPSKEEIASLNASNPTIEDSVAMNRVNTLRMAPDTLIVQESGKNLAQYLVVKRKIERLVLIANEREESRERRGDHDRDRDPDRHKENDTDSPGTNVALGPQDRADEATLRPYLGEIRHLLRIVLQGSELDSD